MIEFCHVSKRFNGKPVLKDCNFHVSRGEIVGLMGRSGSGKTTLAHLLLGLEKPTTGQVLLDGRTYCLKKDGVRIVQVFQDAFHSVNPLFTVEEILTEVCSSGIGRARLIELLEDVGLGEEHLAKRSKHLSGGQLQRICIARALLMTPDVIIFDEALSGLDPLIQGQLLRLIYRLKEKYQQTYLFISHDFNLCYTICNRVLVLYNGCIVDEITSFESPIRVGHPASQNLLKESQSLRYSKCQLRKMAIQLETPEKR